MPELRFDRKRLDIKPLRNRRHDLNISIIDRLDYKRAGRVDKKIHEVAKRIVFARRNHRATILIIGAHVVRSGVQNYLIDLMKKGFISCIATNGAGMIHDFEFALIGATTENVARYIKKGQFGLWKETARLNDIINNAYTEDTASGMGEAVGRYIERSGLPYKSISILANAYRLHIPVTIHIGIGYDIIHEYPNCNGAATGALSYNDFLKFVSIVQHLENGVVMNFGSSVMGPEVFLKALSMARNIAHQQGKKITHFTSLVCDLIKLPKNVNKEPLCSNPAYYFRPWKTMLVRTIANGGEGFYVRGRHEVTIPSLWTSINRLERKSGKSN